MGSRSNKFILNSVSSLMQQVVTIICGLILPQLVLRVFGSGINGTIASITQFLSFITLLQGGVGTVARLAFYKPLAENDRHKISIAYKTVGNFYKKFSIMFVIYLIILSLGYPLLVNTGFDFSYSASLVIILGLGLVFEYFFGQASQMLLFSAQQNYVYSIIQTICTIISTIVGIVLINTGSTIHIVKLVSVLIFAARPMLLYAYVQKRYEIDNNVVPDKDLLSQRMAALVRHIAFYVHTSTDIMILTIFTNVLWVSVYAVHKYVVSSLSNLVIAILGNTEAIFGDMVARNEREIMNKKILIYDLLAKILSGSCFFTCIILISRFIEIYTTGVEDINYNRPVFATLLIISELIYCMGIIYQNIYISAGHIKKTEWIAIVEAGINLGLSWVLVRSYGITGVAIGTVVAVIFKSIANIYYMKKNVLDMSISFIIKSYGVNLTVGTVLVFLFWTIFYVSINNYMQFFIFATITFIVVTGVIVLTNMLFFRNEMQELFAVFRKKILKKK